MRPIRRDRGAAIRERGSASVEFALVLPLVLILTLAILQVGLWVKDQLVVVQAARAGARQGAVSADDESVRRAAEEAAVSLRAEDLEVAVEREGGAGTAVEVGVDYRARVTVPLVEWLFRGTVELSSTAVMRQETG